MLHLPFWTPGSPLRAACMALVLLALSGFCVPASAQALPKVKVQTSMGSFVIELDAARAPLSVANFLEYVRAGHYDGTIFHRVIANFVAQGGGYDAKFKELPVRAKVPNESGNGLSNRRGTVGLARTAEPHSADAQFYINLSDNPPLDPQASRWGYTVFGRVIEGMQIIDAIGAVATGPGGHLDSDVPVKAIVIEKVEELK